MIEELINYILGDSTGISYLGDIPLEIISEKSKSLPVAVTNRRVEKGFNITDTTRAEQMLFSITVVDNSPAYMDNREALEKMRGEGEPITFIFSGRDTYDNVVIENIEEIESGAQKHGFTYYISLRQIQVAELKETDVKVDYKVAKCSGGNKTRINAASSEVTEKEKELVNKKTFFEEITNLGATIKG